MEPPPLDVIELDRPLAGPAPAGDLGQGPEEGVAADDPEHVEAPEGVQGEEPGLGSGGGFHGGMIFFPAVPVNPVRGIPRADDRGVQANGPPGCQSAELRAAAVICYNPAVAELIGTDVLYRKWAGAPAASPAGSSPRAVFLLVHGLGAHSARWEFLAGTLALEGYASYGIELRGFGRTPDRPRGHVDSFRIWDHDILALRDIIGKDHPGRKVFLLGESMGGLIAFNLACRHPEAFAGQVLIAPAFKSALKFPL